MKINFTYLLNFLYPPTCRGCGLLGIYLCNDCKKKIQTHNDICPVCRIKYPNFQVCLSCKNDQKHIEGIIIGFTYNGIIKKLILGLKYKHIRDLVPTLAKQLSYHILSHPISRIPFVISYVPSHWIREHWMKGYNQSKLLSYEVGKILNKRIIRTTKKTRYTRSQVKLSKKKRHTNLIGSFSFDSNQLKGNEHILLIDDITTTGSTLLEVAKTIKRHYPDIKIRGAVIGRNI